jgi:hypothetical protein
MVRTACIEPQCLYSRAIPLLPLLAVRPVQSLSACTVELYLYSPYGPYGLYKASVPVQGCTFIYIFYTADAKVTFGFVMLHLSIRPHGKLRFPPRKFLWNFLSEIMVKFATNFRNWLKSNKMSGHFTVRLAYIYDLSTWLVFALETGYFLCKLETEAEEIVDLSRAIDF